jgi:hypothetical protein
MLTQVFHFWATPLFVGGLAVSGIAWVWFLFASYQADPARARWSRFLPILSIRIALEHPETCLKPFILSHVGLLLCLPQILRLMSGIAAVEQRVFTP